MNPSQSPASRYYGLTTATMTLPDGRIVACLARRLVPHPERFATLQTHRVGQGERLDNVAATFLGDPEQFWRLCDANGALRPDELTERPGRVIRITLPEGVPGARNE